MKKSIIYIMSLGIVFGLGWFGLCEGQKYGGKELQSSNPYLQGSLNNCKNGETDLGNCISINENDDTIIVKLLKNFGLDSDTGKDHKFIDYARAIMNMALGLVAFIALAMSIYTFYMMFFTENEAGIKKAKGSLVGIFIALAVIGLAWVIVSFIFWWYEENWQTKRG